MQVHVPTSSAAACGQLMCGPAFSRTADSSNHRAAQHPQHPHLAGGTGRTLARPSQASRMSTAASRPGGSAHYPLAIVGGGLGGLMAARVLQRNGLDVALFERDPSRESRSQGGMLDLHAESGQWALEAAGLSDEFLSMARPEGQDTRIFDRAGALLMDEVSPPGEMARPEVPRAQLRGVLLDSLCPGTVRWDHALQEVQPAAGAGGRHTLRFANGESATADLVIGADGARSRVRPLLTPAQPSYTGVTLVEAWIQDPDRSHPAVSKLVGRGTLFALGDGKGLLAQRNVSTICLYVALRAPEPDAAGLAQLGVTFGDGPAATRAALARHFTGWAPELTALLDACSDFTPRPLFALPTGVSWPSRRGFTLLGDAAHLMSPFAGAGANLAMQDGADLATKLAAAAAAGGGDVAAAVAAFEAGMFERAAADMTMAEQVLELCMSPDGAAVRLTQFMQALGPQPEAVPK